MIIVLKDGTEVPCDVLAWSIVSSKLRPRVLDGNYLISLAEAAAGLPCGRKAYPEFIDPADILAVIDSDLATRYPPEWMMDRDWLPRPERVQLHEGRGGQ